jgi:PAS domain-containing protein
VDDEVVWRADGSSFPVEYWSYPIRKGEDLIGAVVTFVDISDRRKTEHALQQSEEMFRMLAENIREIFFIFEPHAPRMAYISPACEEISGRPRSEFYQRADAWIDSVHSEDRRHAEAVPCKESPLTWSTD